MGLSRRSLLITSLSAFAAPRIASGQTAFPNKPIRFICPYASGSSSDALSRQVCEKVGEILGQRFVIDNRGGAGGTIGTAAIARSDPDGYTLGMGVNATHAVNIYLQKNLPYSPSRDFSPVALLAIQPTVLVVNQKLGVKTFADFLALLKANPGKYAFGNTGRGTSSHLAGEVFRKMANVDITNVPYPGGQALTDLIGGTIHFMFYPIPTIKGAIDSGDLVALATTNKERLALFMPELPTMIELGYPDFFFAAWLGVYGPAGIPEPIVSTLSAAFRDALKDKTLSDTLVLTGSLPNYLPPDQFRDMTLSEIERYKKVVEIAGLQAE